MCAHFDKAVLCGGAQQDGGRAPLYIDRIASVLLIADELSFAFDRKKDALVVKTLYRALLVNNRTDKRYDVGTIGAKRQTGIVGFYDKTAGSPSRIFFL